MSTPLDLRMLAHRANVELKNDIRNSIAEWKDSQTKPPFTIDELVVMALALHCRAMTQSEVQTWIMQSFGYYLTLGLAIAATPDLCGIQHGRRRTSTKYLYDFRTQITNALVKVELPLMKTRGTENKRKPATDTWKVNMMEARIFFQHCSSLTKQEERGSFPFFRLPTELRLRIYEMALLLPASGVQLKTDFEGKRQVRLQSRDFQEQHKRELVEPETNHPYYTLKNALRMQPFSKHLTLLLVCKQIFEEAMPVFYSENHFAFEDVSQMYLVLSELPESRKVHIGHISFCYQANQEFRGPDAFKLLKGIKYLRKLDIWMVEEDWASRKKVYRGIVSPRYPDLTKIPGLSTLGTIKDLQAVRFPGKSDTIKAHLVPKMQIKRDFKAPKVRKDLIGKGKKSRAGEGVSKKRKAKDMS